MVVGVCPPGVNEGSVMHLTPGAVWRTFRDKEVANTDSLVKIILVKTTNIVSSYYFYFMNMIDPNVW